MFVERDVGLLVVFVVEWHSGRGEEAVVVGVEAARSPSVDYVSIRKLPVPAFCFEAQHHARLDQTTTTATGDKRSALRAYDNGDAFTSKAL